MSFARLASVAVLAAAVSAHMQIEYPAPYRSKQMGGDNIDYSYTAPLAPDGSNFPCKGYHTDGGASQATLKAGENFEVKMSGGAQHNGGSCQFSVSYDGGASFGVMHSVVGGCPTASSYSFQVPAGLPSGDAIFAWTWNNHSGNREMYMNCSPIKVEGGSGSLELDGLYVSNVGAAGNGCETPEGLDVDYANPPCNPSGKVTVGSGAPSAPQAPAPSPQEPAPQEPAPQEPAPQEPAPQQPAPAPVPAPSTGGGCTDGSIICSADGGSWSICSGGQEVAMGVVAPGTKCSNGTMGLLKRSNLRRSQRFRRRLSP